MTEIEKASIAGFLDADGCVNAQIVQRAEYRLKFQIRASITFFQSTKRHWFLLQLHEKLKRGCLRKRNDGMSELSIVGSASVSTLLTDLIPYLKLKKKQAELVLQIVQKLSRKQDKHDFLMLCKLADQVGLDSKRRRHRRTITSALVRETLLFPVETSDSFSKLFEKQKLFLLVQKEQRYLFWLERV